MWGGGVAAAVQPATKWTTSVRKAQPVCSIGCALQLSQTRRGTSAGLCVGFCSWFVPACLLFSFWFGGIVFIQDIGLAQFFVSGSCVEFLSSFSHHRYHITQARFYSCNVAAAVQQSAGNVGGFDRKWFHFVLRIS